MKMLFAAATALAMSGATYAQTPEDGTMDHSAHAQHQMHGMMDPMQPLRMPADWTPQQRMMFLQHMNAHPAAWTDEQRTMFREQLGTPPAQWTAEQRRTYQERMAMIPSDWAAEQRDRYRQQIAGMQTPWMRADTTAAMTDMNRYAAVPASAKIVPPGNSDPELDARGIAVLSAPAVVPPGFNGLPAAAVGGPLADVATGDVIAEDEAYPACTATITDNCVQLYERGVRRAVAEWNRPTGGLDREAMGMGGPYEPVESWSSHATQSSPTGDMQNDLVDTEGASYLPDNQRGIDMDAAPRDDR